MEIRPKKHHNAIVQDNMLAKSINLHETQGSYMSSHSEANDSAVPPINTDSEQNYDVATPPDASIKVQIFNKPRTGSTGRIQNLIREIKD